MYIILAQQHNIHNLWSKYQPFKINHKQNVRFANHISDILRQLLQKAQEANDISHCTLYNTKHQRRGCAVPVTVSPKLAKKLE